MEPPPRSASSVPSAPLPQLGRTSSGPDRSAGSTGYCALITGSTNSPTIPTASCAIGLSQARAPVSLSDGTTVEVGEIGRDLALLERAPASLFLEGSRSRLGLRDPRPGRVFAARLLRLCRERGRLARSPRHPNRDCFTGAARRDRRSGGSFSATDLSGCRPTPRCARASMASANALSVGLDAGVQSRGIAAAAVPPRPPRIVDSRSTLLCATPQRNQPGSAAPRQR